jgi:hypothetical protein
MALLNEAGLLTDRTVIATTMHARDQARQRRRGIAAPPLRRPPGQVTG